MIRSFNLLSLTVLLVVNSVWSDITNLEEFTYFSINRNQTFDVGFLSDANAQTVKRLLHKNVNIKKFEQRDDLLKAIDDEKIVAAVLSSTKSHDLEPKYHVFSSDIVTPQGMLVMPNFDARAARYGFNDSRSQDLFDALNAAIIQMQNSQVDEQLFSQYKRMDMIRAYTCRQDSPFTVVNKDQTTGILREILFQNASLNIGIVGRPNWGDQDGNYNKTPPVGLYPKLLETIVDILANLSGPDNSQYSRDKININRIFVSNTTELFECLMNGSIHATDVFTLLDVPYISVGEKCNKDSDCMPGVICVQNVCKNTSRPRSLVFRSTCTVAAIDSKFVTKKSSTRVPDQTTQSVSSTTTTLPKRRWVGFLTLLIVFFGTIFLALLLFLRRKQNTRFEQTNPGGFGKFSRLREEIEPNMEVLDSFDDHIIQSPRDTNLSNS